MRATLPLALCTIAVLALSWQVAGGLSRDQTAARVDFADDVLPILASNCFRCHGGVREKAGLNLADPDRIRSVLASGHAPVVPGEPARSELLARITSADPDERMPSDGTPLSAADIDTIRRWIEQGASWGTHWSFAARTEPPAPERAARF
ncbi:MAG: hypothetical protein RLZZ116_2892, partial [Planctomycetota bacterium]